MEKFDFIDEIHEPTEWVNSMAVVTKPNGKLRIYIDLRDFNQAIRCEYHPIRTIEETAACMPNAKIFSVLHASSVFWQIKLENESARLCTFNTPFGHYMLKQLYTLWHILCPSCVPKFEICQDFEGVEVLVHDILVWT